MDEQPMDHRAGRKGHLPIYIMGKRYEVPDSLTIQKAMEYAGYRLVRGCGCRGGICGACGTVYRYPGSYKIEIGLACQTVVKPNMHLAVMPFFPANRATYDIEALTPGIEALVGNYPEMLRCMQCNVCTKSCPMEIPVMEYMAAALRGDVAELARLSFDCIMCGLCTSRCPAEICQYNVAILGRRLNSRHLVPRAAHVAAMVLMVEEGRFTEGLSNLMAADMQTLKRLYTEREVEPQGSDDSWVPPDKSNL